ncbi:hypothetical protein BCR41DRAFT_159233 [Lobosporangium transversale]|uniref:Uncharacterized protein n=1 Tax=Lobosporangium transversale TaxID=64571 RepID=A0A1Y2GD08_9FUNG|nr:hypothetical protein BCR41DRAFT_159233 [Lobosporangium transversale]ORZ07477.1 hypothetical protein BCR41DRAFT_159233 [Lobosporangium transversale]|eukprot:XP_021877984.1 hypothetical protein BCR41DRAFT_159233 [Lobosporangium transversale]
MNPLKILQNFEQNKGSLYYISCLLHHYPTEDNRCFKARNFDDNTEITIDIEASLKVEWFNTLGCYKDKKQGSLWIPNSKTFACVEMLIAPNYHLQVTTNKDHQYRKLDKWTIPVFINRTHLDFFLSYFTFYMLLNAEYLHWELVWHHCSINVT